MNKRDLTRREFIKKNAVATVAGTTTLLLGKEAIAKSFSEADLGDLEVVEQTAHISCVDYLKSLQRMP